jgi:hypothetical protein
MGGIASAIIAIFALVAATVAGARWLARRLDFLDAQLKPNGKRDSQRFGPGSESTAGDRLVRIEEHVIGLSEDLRTSIARDDGRFARLERDGAVARAEILARIVALELTDATHAAVLAELTAQVRSLADRSISDHPPEG